jgi:hypothetical protein
MTRSIDGDLVSYDAHGVFEITGHDVTELAHGTLPLVAGAQTNGVCLTDGVCGMPIVQANVYCYSGGAGVWAGSFYVLTFENVVCNP